MHIELVCMNNDVRLYLEIYILYAMDHMLNPGQAKWVFHSYWHIIKDIAGICALLFTFYWRASVYLLFSANTMTGKSACSHPAQPACVGFVKNLIN